MELRDTPEEAAFRAELREWLEENVPDSVRGNRGGEARFDRPEMREWSRALYDAGYAGLTWPEEYGGAGAPYTHQAIFLEEMARAEAPPHRRDRHRHGRPDDHRARHRRAEVPPPGGDPLRRGDLVPGFLRTRCRVRPRGRPHELTPRRRPLRRQRAEGVVVVRTHRRLLHPAHPRRSRLHASRRAQLPDRGHARTRRRGTPTAPDHGEAEFNEIFFTDVRVPAENLLGEIGSGWQVAMTTSAPARDPGLRAAGRARGADREADRARARPRGRPAAARPDRARVDRAAGRPLHELPLARRHS